MRNLGESCKAQEKWFASVFHTSGKYQHRVACEWQANSSELCSDHVFNFQNNQHVHRFCKTVLYQYTQPSLMWGGHWVIHIQQLNKRKLNKWQWRCFHVEEYQMFLLFKPLDMEYLLCDLWKEKLTSTFLSKTTLMVIITPQEVLCASNLGKKHRDLEIYLLKQSLQFSTSFLLHTQDESGVVTFLWCFVFVYIIFFLFYFYF